MGVLWVKPIRSRTWGGKQKGEQNAQRIYRVLCDNRSDDPDLAAEAAAAEAGSVWSAARPGLIVTGVDARETDAPAGTTPDGCAMYDVTIDFGTKAEDPEQEAEDPTARPPQLKLGFDSYEETVYEAPAPPKAFDSDGAEIGLTNWLWGKAVVNSAGRPFDPSVTKVYRDPIITVRKNIATDDFVSLWQTLTDYMDAVNSDAFGITYRGRSLRISAGQAWVADLDTEGGYENGIEFEAVTITLKLRKDGWRRKVLDQGLCCFPANTVPAVAKPAPRARDDAGEEIAEPILLDGKGKKLAEGGKSVFLSWLFEKERPLGRLPLWE